MKDFCLGAILTLTCSTGAANTLECSSEKTSAEIIFELSEEIPTAQISGLMLNCERLPIGRVAEGGTPPIVSCLRQFGPDASTMVTLFAQGSVTGEQKAIAVDSGPFGPSEPVEFLCHENL